MLHDPRSESEQLIRVEELLKDLRRFLFHGNAMMADSTLARVEIIVTRLRQQVESGYHRNPPSRSPSAPFKAGNVVGKIGTDVHEVRYTHAKDGKPYKHEFNGEAEVWAVERNGKRELLITHKHGSPLWDEF